MDIAELTLYLHHEIPLTRAMQLSVLRADADGVRLAFPLAPNDNHKGSAFGGSLSTAATLAAWTALHVRLRHSGIEAAVVIQQHCIDYLHPVHADFCADAGVDDDDGWQRFRRTLARRGRARIELAARVEAEGRLAASFVGTFVASSR